MQFQPVSDSHKATLQHWLAVYRECGYQPLPSRMDRKRPLVTFSRWWDEIMPFDPFDPSRWILDPPDLNAEGIPPHPTETTNVQVMCGRRWKLLVIDLDGQEAMDRWPTMGQCPRTWGKRTGSGGIQWWFRLQDHQLAKRLTKGFLWRGGDKHSGIERLCDGSLAMAAPSIHPRTGHLYRWMSKGESPMTLNRPAPCPDWILAHPLIKPESQQPKAHKPREILEAITPSKVYSLLQSWHGQRLIELTGGPRSSGFMPMKAIGREDQHPSACVHRDSGFYIDSGTGDRLDFLDLGIRLGVYRDRKEAFKEVSNS